MHRLYQAGLRHAQYYEVVLRAARDLSAQGREEFKQALRQFEKDQQNILLALSWAGNQAAGDDAAAQLCHRLLAAGDPFWMARRHLHERIRWLELGRAAARRLGQSAFEGFYLKKLSDAYFISGDYEQALALGAEALSAGFDLQGSVDEALLLCDFSVPSVEIGEVFGEIERTDAFYRLFDLLHRKTGGAGAGLQRADDEDAASTTRQAIELYAASAQSYAQSGDLAGEAKARASLANSYAALGEYQRAIETYRRALKINHELGDQRSRAVIQGILGWLYAALDKMPESVELLTAALATYRRIEDRRGEYLALGGLGAVHAIRGEHDRALDFYHQARGLARELKDVKAESLILSHISLSYESLGDSEQSLAAAVELARLLEQ